MGLFITFEGVEGAGKTTQMDLAEARLRGRGARVFRTREPGGTPIGERIRNVLLSPESRGMDFMTELLLIEACRAQLVREHLRPELEGGSIVLCDRFTDATLAYQGYGRGMDIGLIVKLNEIATEGLCPDLTILLDCPVGVGIERIRGRCSGLSACAAQADERNGKKGPVCVPRTGGPDRLESEERGFHERVRSGYLELAGKSGGRIQVVDSTGDVDAVQGSIFAHLLAAMEGSKQACRSRRSSDRIG